MESKANDLFHRYCKLYYDSDFHTSVYFFDTDTANGFGYDELGRPDEWGTYDETGNYDPWYDPKYDPTNDFDPYNYDPYKYEDEKYFDCTTLKIHTFEHV